MDLDLDLRWGVDLDLGLRFMTFNVITIPVRPIYFQQPNRRQESNCNFSKLKCLVRNSN